MGAAIANWPGTTAKTPGTSAVAYVCGYAVGFDNRALLLPVSASIERDTDALTRSLLAKSLDAVGRSGARAGLVLLDAVASASPTASVGFVAASTAGTPRRERHRSPPRFPRSWRTPTSRSARCLTRCASLVGSSGNQLTVLAPAGRLLAGGIGRDRGTAPYSSIGRQPWRSFRVATSKAKWSPAPPLLGGWSCSLLITWAWSWHISSVPTPPCETMTMSPPHDRLLSDRG
jgi:hypothetical protein